MTSTRTTPRTAPHRGGLRRGLAALALLGAGATALTACGSDDDTAATDTTTPAGSTSAAAPSDAATSEAPVESSPSPTETSSQAEATTSTVPVYWVGTTPLGDRLYREFEQVTGDAAAGAVQALLTGEPLDPDYRSPFTAGSGVASVTDDGGTITVTLSDDALAARPDGTSKADAELAVQAVVYTVQGALQERLPVVVTDPSGGTSLLGVETGGGVSNRDQTTVQSLVNLTTPEEGATVTGGTLTLDGVASSFEATVPWTITDSEGKQVLEGYATAEGWMDKLYPFSTDVDVSDLKAGTYTVLVASSGGEGVAAPMTDTRTFTIG
ncbi:Gmad2 immunoglobulin-like domain-containing protein [Nocardioides bruguierae]|uniref:Gmad2 immunoglobulin-like domain-containing protein n=1 Tax=Nocardioides bruguierae TaxID=2945102 RepID=UPI002021AB98|nr:Gmad2 immunoglobulin-like domain-containing protein [Nocardioides bruguierae]MCL8024673.1 GerMN domain-containing protein [Nocardioides bruguierae]